jgi:hypothetical protein
MAGPGSNCILVSLTRDDARLLELDLKPIELR